MNIHFIYRNFILLILISLSLSCKKLVDITPPDNALTSDNVYTSDVSAIAVLTGLYSKISAANPVIGGSDKLINGISVRAGLSADELMLLGGSASAVTKLVPFYTNSLSSATTLTMWDEFYNNLYVINIALERLSNSSSLTPAVKQQLLGEAKFMRAFYLFYLTNLYGDIPLPISSDYRTNDVLARSHQAEVYQQIINDLKDAQNLLNDKYLKIDAITPYTPGSEERIRPNKWAATALLARTYLYTNNWSDAEVQATSIISNVSLYDTASLDKVFLKNSKEAIWQLQPVNSGWNTEDARVFVLPSGGPNSSANPLFLDSNNLVKAFEVNDQRKNVWINSVSPSSGIKYYYPYKYRSATLNASVSEYLMILRLGEQYLIRAEARAQQNNLMGAKSDIEVIRRRARLSSTAANDKNSLLNAILHERQVELFTEWGHRWFDLKRTGNINIVMAAVASQKGATWNSNWQLYPIPIYEIQQDLNITQNEGY